MEREDLVESINRLREEREAVILAHNYQPPEIQDLADFVGDSLGLARQAAETEARVVVFCGVHFMAETSAILNPDKVTLLPEPRAGCPLADTVTPEGIRTLRKLHPRAVVVTYVNSTAAVKAESDYCCTSGNAVDVVRSIEATEIVFTPDGNLGRYVQGVSGRRLIIWEGCCPIHDGIRAEDVSRLKEEHPEALTIAHPECRPEVLELADAVASTSGMFRVVEESDREEFIILTESGLGYPLGKRFPERRFHFPSPEPLCPDMKMITLEKVERSLRDMEPRVTVPEEIRVRALRAVERMLAVG
ncbi:quinolinate synthase NadA [Candidatus Solincola tengchongensis]|uniref:quinolinate synthase NadA n=1 Tax=Candidatus Solincola tengchongensis TaxID=2900693 RepID=UPI00257CF2BD|nr:quinolinate synthase NadA [Candidatus Solincola tengchongensis]